MSIGDYDKLEDWDTVFNHLGVTIPALDSSEHILKQRTVVTLEVGCLFHGD